MEWLEVLTTYAELGLGVSRHPDDVCRGISGALAIAKGLDGEGLLYRNPATGYFVVTQAGLDMIKVLN